MTAVFYRDTNHSYPLAVTANGMYINDEKGKAYLDMCGGAAVSCLGHQHPDIIAALKAQIEIMSFAHTAFFSSEPQERLAAALCEKYGEAGAKAYFTAGGSEANETALKLSWQYWQAKGYPEKTKIISRQCSYHGNTLGALSVSGNTARRSPVEGLCMIGRVSNPVMLIGISEEMKLMLSMVLGQHYSLRTQLSQQDQKLLPRLLRSLLWGLLLVLWLRQ